MEELVESDHPPAGGNTGGSKLCVSRLVIWAWLFGTQSINTIAASNKNLRLVGTGERVKLIILITRILSFN